MLKYTDLGIELLDAFYDAFDYKVKFRLSEANSNVPYEIAKVPVVPKHVWSKVTRIRNIKIIRIGICSHISKLY